MAQAQTIKVDKDNRTIAVTATDKALTDADLAVVHIGFQVFGPDEQTTYSNGSTISNAIVSTLKKSGVPDKTIESESQNLQPNTDHDPKESEMERAQKQFVLNQSWTVKTTPDDAGEGPSRRPLQLAQTRAARLTGKYQEYEWPAGESCGQRSV